MRELESQPARLDELHTLARSGRVTLLFGAHDETHNNAVALRDVLLGRSQSSRWTRSIRSCRSCASTESVAIGRASSRRSPIGSPVSSQ